MIYDHCLYIYISIYTREIYGYIMVSLLNVYVDCIEQYRHDIFNTVCVFSKLIHLYM